MTLWQKFKNFFLLTFFQENSFCRVFLRFLVFFHLFSSLINQWPNQRPFSPWRKARSGKVHIYENHQRSTVFRTVQKNFPRGATKVPKSAKLIFLTESLWSIWWFEQPERSARSRTIRSKIVSIQWGFQKCNSFTCRRHLKKVDFFEFWHYDWSDDKSLHHVELHLMQHTKQLQRTWNCLGGWGLLSVRSKISLGQNVCQKVPESVN